MLGGAYSSHCVIAMVGLYNVGAVGTIGLCIPIPCCALSSESGLWGLDGGIALVDAYSGGESSARSLSDVRPKSLSLNGVLSGDGVCDVAMGGTRAAKRPRPSLGWSLLDDRLVGGWFTSGLQCAGWNGVVSVVRVRSVLARCG